MSSTITIPTFPRYGDHRELKPPADPAELTKLCGNVLKKHGKTVDQLHPDVRKMLVVGHVAGRRWACGEVRRYLTTTGRDQLLTRYFEMLETARLAAKALSFVEFMPDEVLQSLEIQVDPTMPYELRVRLRKALVQVQDWDNQSSKANGKPARSNGTRSERTARPKGASRPFGRVPRGEKASIAS